ncbi:MAG: hypothetical protein OXB98_15420 [Bryobacterales bacterium]|nr:hypothetical protein [Bryobacterales bacterium]
MRIKVVKENLTFSAEDSLLSNLILSVIGAIAAFKRILIRKRQREGIALAKQLGAYRGRKRIAIAGAGGPDTPAQLVQVGERKSPQPAVWHQSRNTNESWPADQGAYWIFLQQSERYPTSRGQPPVDRPEGTQPVAARRVIR